MNHSLKFCTCHKVYGHTIAKCFRLREEIKSLILKGYLTEFVVDMRQAQRSIEKDRCK